MFGADVVDEVVGCRPKRLEWCDGSGYFVDLVDCCGESDVSEAHCLAGCVLQAQ